MQRDTDATAGSDSDGDVTWSPSRDRIARARITEFSDWLRSTSRFESADYQDLWQWSVRHPEAFWSAVAEFFGVAHVQADAVLPSRRMPFSEWFPGVRLNFVDTVLGHAGSSRPAIIDDSEPGGPGPRVLSWSELALQVTTLASWLRENGVGEGDRVVGYFPNVAEAVIAFLATASVGAIWSCCGQDYEPEAVIDRLEQLEPTVLFAADGYRYGGKEFDRIDAVRTIRSGLPTLREVVLVERLQPGRRVPWTTRWADALSADGSVKPEQVAFTHPLWILFSSGTTGKPKGFVHSHGGVLLEHLKGHSFHLDLGPTDTLLWYTTPSWMVWNSVVSGLLVGATIVCYDGSPAYPDQEALWMLAARHGVSMLGTSPGYIQACMKAGATPARTYRLDLLRTIGATGSVVAPELTKWVAEQFGGNVPLATMTGGTDVASSFAGFVPSLPARAGELTAPHLGVALDSWDAVGRPVRDVVGELVVTQPMPSMPLRLWDDPDGNRYRETYFAMYDGVWRHGDWVTITSSNSVIVHGRSDSTLNRNGIRIGTADIYRAVDDLPEVTESLVIGAEQPGGEYWMPMFITLREGAILDDDLRRRIFDRIRAATSPRHVPDDIVVVTAIPHTRTGKKLEVPVKRILQGAAPTDVADARSLDDPSSLDFFVDYADHRASRNG